MGKSFGEKLRSARRERFLSRSELGEPLLREREVSLLESGRREPGRAAVRQFAQRLATAPGTLPRPAGPDGALHLGLTAHQLWDERDYGRARDVAADGARAALAEQDPPEWWALTFLAARCQLRLGDFEGCVFRASLLARHPLALAQLSLRARAKALLATAHQGRGHLGEAVRQAQAAVAAAQKAPAGNDGLLEAYQALAAALTESGRLAQAWEVCRVFLVPLLDTVPDSQLAGKGFWTVGNVAFRRGDPAAGVRFHQQAAALLSPRLDLGLWASFNKASASMRLSSGLHDAQTLNCIEHAETALAVVGESRTDAVELLHSRGRWQHLQGNHAEAVNLLSAAYAERTVLAPQTAAEVALQLGLSLASLGRSCAAAARLAESEALFRRAGAADRSGHAKALAASLSQGCQG
ncbi:helix-turn-helix transcriptional regulator [Arthrobacter sp. Sa2CUA1]|uniref:Helix-turn-helix transcriptional regulator n=1 Tax=Arthrobacter gallicola TaxID=2762225 RepID=A0ABR8UUQ8_9MICC|nr:helix-turn-helix transcriptional regulator [Arthrobacter gallicola]MBD7996107.1 helix-turn-helix transcriptional regulator [Arthrobacter gallicola]